MPAKKASFEGACEVFNAVLATSLTVLAVFLPVTLIPGVVGQFFSAFAMTVCIAIVLSTFDALTVAPMLSAYLMGFGFKKSTSGPNLVLRQCQRFGRFFSGAYEKILYFSLDRPKTVLVSATVIFFSSFLLLKSIGFTFIQEPDNGEIDVVIETSPGTSILNTNFHARVIEEKLSKFPGIDFISARVGSELSEDNQATIYVQLIPYADRSLSTAEVKKEIRAHLSTYAKSNDLKLNVRSSGGGGGGRKPISLAIQGPNIEVLQRITNQAMAKIREDLPGIVDLESNLQGGRSEIKFRVIPERLAAFDLSTDQVGQSLRGMYEGLLAGQYRDQGEEYDIRVRLKPEDRMGMTTLAMATVTNQKGQAIPLGAVTEQLSGEAPTKIVRIDQTRAALLEADMAPGFPLGTAIEDIKKIVAPMLPALYTMEFQGQAKSLNDLAIGAAIAFSLGSLFIYMIMAALYESFILPFAILLTLPLAVVGALLALLIAGVNLDLYAIIGVILLMGLVTKNAILLVDYVEQLRGEGLDRISALKAAGKRRMRPIMMTTIAMIAGMLPVALGFGELNKIRAGMGLASIGGLLSSTLLSLIVIPCAYIYLDKLRIWSGKTVAKFMRA
jgi:HAE1 family hydrophobic/amphiphilic exporter-1